MKWLLRNKFIVGISLMVFLWFAGCCLMALGEMPSLMPSYLIVSPENPTINVTITELVVDEALQAELDATKSKLKAMEWELSILLSAKGEMAVELNQALAQLATLRAHQQPDLVARYSELNTKYQRQYGELLELKANYEALLAEYNELARAHDLCGEGEE